jgi:Pretoxin HINT domain
MLAEALTMISITLIGACLLLAFPEEPPLRSHDLETYQALKAKGGKDAKPQVKLALWCEAHGLNSQRIKHLAQAVLSDPKDVTARGLMGLLAFGERWESIERVAERMNADENRVKKLSEYAARRAKVLEKESEVRNAETRSKTDSRPGAAYAEQLKARRALGSAHASLGVWCKANALGPEATAHFTMAVHLDPSRDTSWRNLGYVRHNGRWTTPEQAATDEREEHEQRMANRLWEPLLRKWKNWLGDPSSSRRSEAAKRLSSVTDPRAVPSILKVFSTTGRAGDETALLQLLTQIDKPSSSLGLAKLAATTRSPSVRLAAIDVLKTRPRRDYVGQLVSMIHGKIEHAIVPVNGPGSTGTLVLDTQRVRMVLNYEAPTVVQLGPFFRGYVGYDANGLPMIAQGAEIESLSRQMNPFQVAARIRQIEVRTAETIAEANLKAEVVRQRMAADLNAVETANDQAAATNQQIIPVLELTADAPASLKDDEEAWNAWWSDQLGYSYESPPKVTIVQDGTPPLLPPPVYTTCFVAGTPVRTLDGSRPIEAIHVGDQVLSQDGTNGELAFRPVVNIHHNPPGKTLRVELTGGESIRCSVYHRFWRANAGWVMARELVAGDTLRTASGLVRVAHVEADARAPLFNLDIAGLHTFFAGAGSLLVHDNTLPDHRLVPFDALPVWENTPPN